MNLEQKLKQKDINITPKTILEKCFVLTDEKRILYEEQIPSYKKQIARWQMMINDFKMQLKTSKDLTEANIQSVTEFISDLEEKIKNAKLKIRLIGVNCNILWNNQLKMDKVLGYGLID